MEAGLGQGRIFQGAWNLAFFATISILTAIFLNWKSSRIGYWINLAAISVTDIGFILFLVVPGYIPIIPGIYGPMVWVLGVICTTMGYQRLAIALQKRRLIVG